MLPGKIETDFRVDDAKAAAQAATGLPATKIVNGKEKVVYANADEARAAKIAAAQAKRAAKAAK